MYTSPRLKKISVLLFAALMYGGGYCSLTIADTASEQENIIKEYLELADGFSKSNNKEKARYYHDRVLSLNPEHPISSRFVGNAIRDADDLWGAIPYYENGLKSSPNDIPLLLELANTYNMLDEIDKSLDLYMRVIELNPHMPAAVHNFAFTLKKKGYHQQSIEVFDRLLERQSDYALAHFNLSSVLMAIGEWERGWEEYEWRWAAYNETPKKFDQPRWDGIASLEGKKIFIYAEQGIGDTFQFIRYLKVLKQRGAFTIFGAPVPLVKILTLCPYIDLVISDKDEKPDFDFHIPLMSLPYACKTTVDSVPYAHEAYLTADQNLVEYWKTYFAQDKNFKIGVCWHGNSRYPTQALRRCVAAKSIPLALLGQLSKIPGVSLYSIQRVDGGDEENNLPEGIKVHTLPRDYDLTNGRFMDTAAIMKNMDLIITIDTSIVHLAGGLHVNTWLLLPEQADWRWLVNQTTTPWYSSVQIFWQKKLHDWNSIMEQITPLVEQRAAEHVRQLQEKSAPVDDQEAIIQRTLAYVRNAGARQPQQAAQTPPPASSTPTSTNAPAQQPAATSEEQAIVAPAIATPEVSKTSLPPVKKSVDPTPVKPPATGKKPYAELEFLVRRKVEEEMTKHRKQLLGQ